MPMTIIVLMCTNPFYPHLVHSHMPNACYRLQCSECCGENYPQIPSKPFTLPPWGKKSFLLSIQIPPQFSLPVLLSGHPLASTALRKSNSNLSNLCLQLKRCKHGNMFCTSHQHNHFLLIIWWSEVITLTQMWPTNIPWSCNIISIFSFYAMA